jgi:hypothetical protein
MLNAPEVATILNDLPDMYRIRVKEMFERELLFGEPISLADLSKATGLSVEAILLNAR